MNIFKKAKSIFQRRMVKSVAPRDLVPFVAVFISNENSGLVRANDVELELKARGMNCKIIVDWNELRSFRDFLSHLLKVKKTGQMCGGGHVIECTKMPDL